MHSLHFIFEKKKNVKQQTHVNLFKASEVEKSKSLGYIQTLSQDFSKMKPESVEEMIECLVDEAELGEVDLEAILKAELEELELFDENESVL